MRLQRTQPHNDNAPPRKSPVVIIPRGRKENAFARAENLILPLRFARRMDGWETTGATKTGDA